MAHPAAELVSETPGQRLYRIRLACGDGVRRAESLDEFSQRLRKAGKVYDPATLSRLERGLQRWSLEDINALAAADPLERGAPWLAWGDAYTNVPTKPTLREKPKRRREKGA